MSKITISVGHEHDNTYFALGRVLSRADFLLRFVYHYNKKQAIEKAIISPVFYNF